MSDFFNVALNKIPAISTLKSYEIYVNSIPNMTKEEEFEVADLWKKYKDIDAAKKLILSQLKTVVKISKEFINYGIPREDLIQEGNIGLMKAVKSFDPEKGYRLFTFAMVWIRSSMMGYILENVKIIKLGSSKSLKKLFFNYAKLTKDVDHISKEKIESIAKELNISEKDVIEYTKYSSTEYIDLNEQDEDKHFVYQIPTLETPENILIEKDFEEKQMDSLNKALSSLNDKEKELLYRRYFKTPQDSLKIIGADWGLSIERIRQIESKILTKLKKMPILLEYKQ